jgi:hypothetical protein
LLTCSPLAGRTGAAAPQKENGCGWAAQNENENENEIEVEVEREALSSNSN